jgi:primosomal protein N' (replication factor Y) (superfamily II helicase)
MNYIKAAVFANIDNLLTYSIETTEKDLIGRRVIVPLGQRFLTGLIVETAAKADIEASKIKPVKEIIDPEPVVSAELIKLGTWVADYYICGPGIVFGTMLAPLSKMSSKKMITLIKQPEVKLSEKLQAIVDYLSKRRGKRSNLTDIAKVLGFGSLPKLIGELEDKGIIESEGRVRVRERRIEPVEPDKGQGDGKDEVILNKYQQEAVEKITANIDKDIYATFLLMGITGSGKTEVYIKAAEHTVSKGKKVMILVPEIFLTPQITGRFKRAFGARIAVYHSGLKENERFFEWQRMKDGLADVVIGTRSAVFAPFENPGLIVVDEEFDNSYKQENDPRYNARDVAVIRASMCKATVVLGSATPSVETYHNASIGKYTLLDLPGRAQDRPLPEISVVDLKNDMNKMKDMFFSNELIREMRAALDDNGQAILFMNRRGYSSYIFCRECGHIEKCVNCDIPLVYHKEGSVLKCHYCGFEKEPQLLCPACKKPLLFKGLGTQRIEDVVKKFFPDKKVLRVDIDSMKDKQGYFEVYRRIKDREIDILVGTQMIVKGFDFPEVTFVGVVSIDTILNLPDFRSDERVYQLITQVAGRTGRGDRPGIVVVQTFNPDSLGIKSAVKYDSKEFYSGQVKLRKEHSYPPFASLLQIIIQDVNEEKCAEAAEKTAGKISKIIEKHKINGLKILGPAPAPLSRIRNKYRYSIILKSPSRKDLNVIGREIRRDKRGSDIAVIVDPVNTL